MSLVVGVRFAEMEKTYYFDPGDLELEVGDSVLVETVRGEEVAEVVIAPREVQGSSAELKKVLRLADETDSEEPERNARREEEAFQVGEEKIRKHNLDMKLIDVEYAQDGSKLIFYFSAEGRIDFRELVKDLASVFRTRIELRQIGVRDEAKKIGGLGPCGRPCCCNAYMNDFVPVSIKMAKEQNLSLSPTKISGLCGRLMCCLHFEQDHYHAMRKRVPRVGSYMNSPAGAGEVCSTDVLTGRTKIRIELQDGTFEMHTYELEELSPYEGSRPPAPVPRPEPAPVERQQPRRGGRKREGRPTPARHREVPRKEKSEQREARAERPKEPARKEGKSEQRRRPRPPRKEGTSGRSGAPQGGRRRGPGRGSGPDRAGA